MNNVQTVFAIAPKECPRLRVGVKWDPLERDTVSEAYGLHSVKDARARIAAIESEAAAQLFMIKLFKSSFFFTHKAGAYERALELGRTKKHAYEIYLAQAKLLSVDLDLCCACYDKNGTLVKLVSPFTIEDREAMQKQMAFLHSGDDDTGTGETFDEEILVNVEAIDAQIDKVFFFLISKNHDFDQVKNGSWSIIKTTGEVTLLFNSTKTEAKHRLHVMAKMVRDGDSWTLERISEFLPLDNGPNVLPMNRIDQILAARYHVHPDASKTS